MQGLGPFGWASVHVGIFSITSALFAQAAAQVAAVPDADDLGMLFVNLSLGFAVAAGAALAVGLVSLLVQGGQRAWRRGEDAEPAE